MTLFVLSLKYIDFFFNEIPGLDFIYVPGNSDLKNVQVQFFVNINGKPKMVIFFFRKSDKNKHIYVFQRIKMTTWKKNI